MKNYIEYISDEELRFICSQISAKTLRDFYQKNGTEFSKLKPGFRPRFLTDEETYSFACSNKNTPFLADFLNFAIGKWLQEIRDAKEAAVNDGETEIVAYIETLAKSFFDENPALYFKITEESIPVENQDLFFYAIKVAVERNYLSRISENIDSIDDRIEQIKASYESAADELRLEYEEALQTSKQEVDTLKSTNEQIKARLEGVESSRGALEEELKTYRELSAHMQDEEDIKPTPGYHYASLCITYVDDLGRDRLKRVADVRDGELSESLIESAPDYTRLYSHDGPTREGSFGVWDWRVIPNKSDPAKDYIETSYNNSIKPIEVIAINECSNIEELVEILKRGISVELHTERILFAILAGGKYEGVYCDLKDLVVKSELIELKKEVLKLPVYTFYRIDTLHREDTVILHKTAIGLPQRLVYVHNPMDVVRNCILGKATWPVSQQKGFVRNEYQKIRSFITELQTEDLYEDISKKCDCSVDEAVEYVTAFMSRADKVVVGNTIENTAMVQVIKNDPEAYAKCMNEIRNEWEHEHESLLNDACEAVNKVKEEEDRVKESVEKKNQELAMAQKKLDECNQEFEKRIATADEVQQLVAQKIESAKNNAAAFIADNAFIQAISAVTVSDKNPETNRGSVFKEHDEINSEEPDVNETPDQLLQTVQYELSEAGVSDESASGVAALLYSAYIRRMPLLLAGPNGRDIADAFSAAISCQTAAVIECGGNDTEAINKCEASNEKIVVIENPLQVGWENAIIKLISKRERFYILTQPFSDDLVVEPRGLFNYCLPVLTEMFVISTPARNYTGGILSEDFAHYHPENTSRLYGKALDELNITSITRENIQMLISDINKLNGSVAPDTVLEFLLYPLMYAIGESQTLIGKLDTLEQKPSAITVAKLKRLIGEGE